MRLVGWLGVVMVGAVLLLTGAEGADERRVLSADAEGKGLSQRIAALEARLRVLEGAVQVNGPTVKIVSGAELTIKAGTNIALHGGSTVGILGAAGVDIRGAKVMLGPGGRPIARLGDPVLVDGKPGKITGGSSTVLAQ